MPIEDGFLATCTWNVAESVGHWGHIHQRINRYSAELNIQPVDEGWKILKMDILEESRVK